MAAPDKFRGTATAAGAAAAITRAAGTAGWAADSVPLADGGEGTLDAVGGDPHRLVVTGPLGEPVVATWRLLGTAPGAPGTVRGAAGAVAGARGAGAAWAGAAWEGAAWAGAAWEGARAVVAAAGNDPWAEGPVAVVESAQAVGRALLGAPRDAGPLEASTRGVGELIVAAAGAGARVVVVGVGGTASTDGGAGALSAIADAGGLPGARLIAACDVRTRFLEAARVFGPQKGATPAQVEALTARLGRLAERYRRTYGVDVTIIPGGGAGGGLAGGLAALGATVVPGFDLVARVVGLAARLDGADAVVTGEGHLDASSLAGKVVGGVIDAVAGRVPVLCVVGDADPDVVETLARRAPTVTVARMAQLLGTARALGDATTSIETVVREWLARRAGL